MLELHLAFKVPVTNYTLEKLTPMRVRARPSLWSVRVTARKYRTVVEDVAKARGMDPETIMYRGDFDTHIRACGRHEVMWRLRQMGHSYPAIARVMGHKCHTTIINGSRQHAKRMAAVQP